MKTVAPLVFGFVLLFAFVLMLVSFRSLVIAAKTIVLNLLSVGAAYGILVLVFQHGWGKQLLGFEFTGGIDPFLPILLFVILFGLSMDYHVFVLSRVREGYDSGMRTDEAVAHGIKSTAGVVTSAAIVMVGVFAIFATLQMMIFKQFGVGLASAILIDATLIRAILLPASDEAARRLELVSAEVARVAAPVGSRAHSGSAARAGGRGLDTRCRPSLIRRPTRAGPLRHASQRLCAPRSGWPGSPSRSSRSTSSTTTSCSRTPAPRPATISSAGSSHSGSSCWPASSTRDCARAPARRSRSWPASSASWPERRQSTTRRKSVRPATTSRGCCRSRPVCCSSASALSRCGDLGEPTTGAGGGTSAGSCSSPRAFVFT